MLNSQAEKETPFIPSDLIAPGSNESESDVYGDVIPIRTW